MATLTSDQLMEKITIKSKDTVVKKSKSGSIVGYIGEVFYEAVHDPDFARDKFTDEIKNEFALLQEDLWKTLSPQQKMIVVNIVRDIEEIRKSREGIADAVLDERMKTVQERFENALQNVGAHVSNLESLLDFGSDGLADVMGKVDGGSISETTLIPSEEDLQIVTILKMMGTDLEFNGQEWKVNPAISEFSFAPMAKGETSKLFEVFTPDNIVKLVDYLNHPSERGDKRIVPGKLLQVYMEVYANQMGAKDRSKSASESAEIGDRINELGNIFNIKSNEYKITRLLDPDTMIRNAQRVAIVSAYEQMVSAAPDSIISDIRGAAETTRINNSSYKKAAGHLGRLVNLLNGKANSFEDATEFDVSYSVEEQLKEYDEQIRYLEVHKKADLRDKLIEARNCFIATVELQKQFWQNKLQQPYVARTSGGNIISENFEQIFSESVGIAIVQNGGKFEMANGDAVKAYFDQLGQSEVFEELKARLQDKTATRQQILDFLAEKGITPKQEERQKSRTAESGEAELEHEDGAGPRPAQPSGSKHNFPDITRALSSGVDGYNNAVMDYSNLQFYRFLWETALDEAFNAFKKKGFGTSVSDFISHLKQNEDVVKNETGYDGIFDFEILEEAYFLAHEDEKKSEQVDRRIRARQEAFDKHILLADIILSQLSEEERAAYRTLSEADKQKLLEREYKKAQEKYDQLKQNPEEYNKWLARAKKRQEHGLVGATINKLWGDRDNADWGKMGFVKDAIEAFLDAEANTQRASNAELSAAGEPVIDCDDPESEQNKDASGKKKPPTTFGDVYPSGPNTNKFLKKMKPYHPKEITKHFIEPLLEALDGIEINMDAYYAKLNTSSSRIYRSRGQGPRQAKLTPEQQKAFEEQMQQQETHVTGIMQRHYEASAFIPASLMLENVVNSMAMREDFDKGAGEQYKSSATHLKGLFDLISSTDELGEDKKLGIVDPETKTDVRDALRGLVLGVFRGDFQNSLTTDRLSVQDNKGSEAVKTQLAAIFQKYQVPAELQQRVTAAFIFITPEFVATALEPVVTISEDKQSVTLEPRPIEGILRASNDAERRAAVQSDFDMSEHLATSRDLMDLVTVIYREKGENADYLNVDSSSIEMAFTREQKKVEYGQIRNTEAMKKILEAARRDIREKAGLSPQADQAEAEGPEMAD